MVGMRLEGIGYNRPTWLAKCEQLNKKIVYCRFKTNWLCEWGTFKVEHSPVRFSSPRQSSFLGPPPRPPPGCDVIYERTRMSLYILVLK